jgi:predicted dehydrogenase
LNYVQRPTQHNFTIVGRNGVIRWDNADGVAILEAGGRRIEVSTPEQFERNVLFIDELNHFFDCAAGRDKPACSLEDGERTLAVCLSAKESARCGRTIDV